MGWVVKGTPRPLYPQKIYPVPIVLEARWAPGSVWTGAKYLASTGIFLFKFSSSLFVLYLCLLTCSDFPASLIFVLTVQHTQHKRPCPRRDSNPQSQQASGHRPTP